MEQQEPTEFILDVFTDPRSVRDVVTGAPSPSPSLSLVAAPSSMPFATPPPRPSSAAAAATSTTSIRRLLLFFACSPALPSRPPSRSSLHILTSSSSPRRFLLTQLLAPPGILHTIFFNRFFPFLTPQTRDVLDLTLPYVDDDELQTLIEQRAFALERALDDQRTASAAGSAPGGPGPGGRAQVSVRFFEKRRRKAWLSRGDDEVCWECWTVKVTVADPRTESGSSCLPAYPPTLVSSRLPRPAVLMMASSQSEPRSAVPWNRPFSPLP